MSYRQVFFALIVLFHSFASPVFAQGSIPPISVPPGLLPGDPPGTCTSALEIREKIKLAVYSTQHQIAARDAQLKRVEARYAAQISGIQELIDRWQAALDALQCTAEDSRCEKRRAKFAARIAKLKSRLEIIAHRRDKVLATIRDAQQKLQETLRELCNAWTQAENDVQRLCRLLDPVGGVVRLPGPSDQIIVLFCG